MGRARLLGWLVAMLACIAPPAFADGTSRLVLGSFSDAERAARWARTLEAELPVPIAVVAFDAGGRTVYRTVTEPLGAEQLRETAAIARAKGIATWRWVEASAQPARDGVEPAPARVAAPPSVAGASPPPSASGSTRAARGVDAPTQTARAAAAHEAGNGTRRDFDFDLGVQTRAFAEPGADDQSRFDPSLSARAQYYRAWNDERQSVRAIPFARFDADDDRRTHADLRELQYTLVGDTAELHVGVRQVFWGVTEFEHLVDIINQTDLVEDIDGEQKLGQPMANLSLVQPWGVVDLYLMTGFRERTYPGDDGRLRLAVPVDTSKARYESGDREWHVDGAIRWSDHLGPVELGLYQFSGTSREPELVPTIKPSGKLVLIPYYPLIDQTGLDGQAIIGNWLWKLEALSRSGFGDSRYEAATGGFEWTWVGALGTRSDVGFVLEYMWDSRDDAAQSVFEHDVGVATRWRFNDPSDTAVLIGLVWDTQTHESIVKLEGSTRLSDTWSINLEGRLFSGASTPPRAPTSAVLAALLDPDNKTGSVQRDDFLSLELVRYF